MATRRSVSVRFLVAATLAVTLALAAVSVPAKGTKDTRFVSVGKTRLLSKPMAFSPAVATLDAGDAVQVLAEKGGYLQVDAGGTTGWIPARAVQKTKPAIGYSAEKTSDTSSEEIAAATKGFNSAVEAEYADAHPEARYDLLDQLEKRTAVADPVASLESFRREGKLGEFAPGAAR